MYTWVTPCLSRNRTLKQTNFPMWPIDWMDDTCNVNECHPTFFLTWWDNNLIRTHLNVKIEKCCNSNMIFGYLLIRKYTFTTFNSFGKHPNSMTNCWNLPWIHLDIVAKNSSMLHKNTFCIANLNSWWVNFLMQILFDTYHCCCTTKFLCS